MTLPTITFADLDRQRCRTDSPLPLPPDWSGTAVDLLLEADVAPSLRLHWVLQRGRMPEVISLPFALWCIEEGLQHPYYRKRSVRDTFEYRTLREVMDLLYKSLLPGHFVHLGGHYRMLGVDVHETRFYSFHMQHLIHYLSDPFWDIATCACVNGRVAEMYHDDRGACSAYYYAAAEELAGRLVDLEMNN